MDVARLNFSHGRHEDHALVLERLHRLGPAASRVEIDTEINECLDRVIERARRRMR